MHAVDLLTEQHREIERLFERVSSSRRTDERERIFEELAAYLVAHDAVEREIFYPACERVLGRSEPLVEGFVEHGLLQFTLLRADQARGTDSFCYLISVLEEIFVHHVEEEEAELLSQASRSLRADLLETLAVKMSARFASSREEGYRRQLRESVEAAVGVRAAASKRAPSVRRKRSRTLRATTRSGTQPKRAGRAGD